MRQGFLDRRLRVFIVRELIVEVGIVSGHIDMTVSREIEENGPGLADIRLMKPIRTPDMLRAIAKARSSGGGDDG